VNGPALLHAVQGLLERTYDMRTGIGDVGRFVIGDRGYRLLYRARGAALAARASGPHAAATLVRETAHGPRVNVYFPDDMIRRLERRPPQRGLGEENVDDFAVLVEELDHLLVLADRHRQQRSVSLFELELHANVSKYLVLTRYLVGARRFSERLRVWLRHQLFEKGSYCDEDPVVRNRYREAERWAVRLLDRLARLDARTRLERLRRFHTLDTAGKLELIGF
jgi:hypothetical protein